MAPEPARCAFLAAHAVALRQSSFTSAACRPQTTPRRARRAQPVAALDPSFVHSASPFDLGAATHFLAAAAGAVADSATDVASAAAAGASAVADAAGPAGEAVVEAKKAGWIQQIAHLIEIALEYIHASLRGAGVPGAYGVSIILFTVLTKVVTFPLNFKQMESTIRMQALTPRLKAIQSEYKDNPAVVNQMTAKLYKDENINPLLGCLPILVQFPIWIALYRALQNLAKADLLNEAFLWIPSLQGPVSQTGQGINTWLFPLVDGAPPAGWHDAIAYLVLPAMLVVSQIYSASLMQPPSSDPTAQQTSAMNKFLPIMVGFFVLNVPAALGVYMLTNNVVTTTQTLIVRKQLGYGKPATALPVVGGGVKGPPAPDGFKAGAEAGAKAPAVTRAAQKGKGKTGKSGKSKRRKRR